MATSNLFSKRVWAVIALIGVVLVFAAGAFAANALLEQTRQRTQNTVSYIKTQSFIYDFYNSASTTKSLMRSIENAQQLSRNLETSDDDISQQHLREYVNDLRLTSVFVLSPKGKLLASYSKDDISFDDLSGTLLNESLLDVASNPKKTYTLRVKLPDSSYVDIGACGRTDAKGVVVGAYHTSNEFADRYKLTLQSLLSGYDVEENGSIVIQNDSAVVASNTVEDATSDTVLLSQEDSAVVAAMNDRLTLNEPEFFKEQGTLYYGLYGKIRDYYVYAYVDASSLVASVAGAAVITLILYGAIIVVLLITRRRTQHAHLVEMVEQEHKYASQLEDAAQAAQKANASKTEFLQRMSHDIRTPINGIRGMVEIGDVYADDPAKQKECREKIWTASGLLLDLVNEVLDMSKLESGEVTLDIQPMNIQRLGDEVCEMLERQAAARDIKIVRELDQLEHPCVMASPLHLKRLVMNMASNAVKYNRHGGTVRVSCTELDYDTEGRATYRFVIADNGIGMSDEFQKHLYEPFAREMQETTYKPSGTGLGMVITKQLVEVMGGTIKCDSVLGEGTIYTVDLPFDVVPDERMEECAVHEDDKRGSGTLEGLNILLAEDNELNREIAEFVITRAGASFVSAVNGREAVELFEQSEPGSFDVILMDIMMPVMDGYEATRTIRKLGRPDALSVPIIAMSANAFSDDVVSSRKAGMSDHLAKPIDSDELVKSINSILRRGGGVNKRLHR